MSKRLEANRQTKNEFSEIFRMKYVLFDERFQIVFDSFSKMKKCWLTIFNSSCIPSHWNQSIRIGNFKLSQPLWKYKGGCHITWKSWHFQSYRKYYVIKRKCPEYCFFPLEDILLNTHFISTLYNSPYNKFQQIAMFFIPICKS